MKSKSHGLLYILFTAFLLAACSQAFSEKSAIIEDYVVGSVYEVVSVNGEQVKRVHHGLFVTKVPYVLVSEGSHTLSLVKHRDDDPAKNIELEVTVQKGNTYRLIERNNAPFLIEIKKY